MTRSLMMLGLLAVVGFMAGWFTINRDGERTTIEINRDEIRNDARTAIDRGRSYLEQRREQQAAAQSDGWGNPPAWNPPVGNEGVNQAGNWTQPGSWESQRGWDQNGNSSQAANWNPPGGWNTGGNGYGANAQASQAGYPPQQGYYPPQGSGWAPPAAGTSNSTTGGYPALGTSQAGGGFAPREPGADWPGNVDYQR